MDKYKKIRQIGEGSFGVAHLARVKQSGKYVVIKEVNLAKLSKSDQDVARKEVVVLSQLKHCNIVAYLDSFENRSVLALVMDYCDGGDLSERIKAQNGNLFKEDQILNWFVQLCLAVKYIHDKNILHRDIKTQNLFLTKHGLLKLGDFGIAKVLGSTGDLARTCIGTPYYLSPEICWGKLYDNKSDIWSMGCVLYELSALKHAFEATNMQELISKIMSATYPEISSIYSSDLKSVVSAMLKRNPSYRPSCDTLLKKPILQSRLKHLLSDLGLVFDPSPRRPAGINQKKQSVQQEDKSIFISGMPFQIAQDDVRVSRAIKRPMSSDANNARIKRDAVPGPDKENIMSKKNYNNNYNRNKYHKPRTPLSRVVVNSSRKDATLKLKGIGIVSRICPKMNVIKSGDSRSRTPSVTPPHGSKQDLPHHHPPPPLHRHHPFYAEHGPYEQPQNNFNLMKLRGRVNVDDAHSRRASPIINNNIHNHKVVYNSHSNEDDNCINRNINNNNNNVIWRQKPRVPPVLVSCDPVLSDHEPSPARLRDEERNRQDREYMKRFREIRLDNLREKFHKKMEQLEAMNPITGLPQPPDQSDIDQRKRKLSLMKAQVDARVEKIKKEMERRREDEYVRESIKISMERREIPDSLFDADRQRPVVTPPNDRSLPSANLKIDRVMTSPSSNEIVGVAGERVDPMEHEDMNKKKTTILRKINDHPLSNHGPDLKSTNQSKWREMSQCNNLGQLDLEESRPVDVVDHEIKSGRLMSERRHWLPATNTIIKNLSNETMEITDPLSICSTLNMTMTLSTTNHMRSTHDDDDDDDVKDTNDDDNDYALCDDVDWKVDDIDLIDAVGSFDDNTDNDGTTCDVVNGVDRHDNECCDVKQNHRLSEGVSETSSNLISEFQNAAVTSSSSSSSSSSTVTIQEKFLSNLKLFFSKLIKLELRKRRSSESDVRIMKRGEDEFVVCCDKQSGRILGTNHTSEDRSQVSDFSDPSDGKVKSSIKREAFMKEELSTVNLKDEINDCNTKGKTHQQSCNEPAKVFENVKEGVNFDKGHLSSKVNGSNYEEMMKRKRMKILELINKSFEVERSLNTIKTERDGLDDDCKNSDVDNDAVAAADDEDDEDDDDDDDDDYASSDGSCDDEEEESDEHHEIIDEDLEEEGQIMMESMANLLVANPEDISGEFIRRASKKKRMLPSHRIIIRKPLVKMRRRKKRDILSSWSSGSIEDLQTMKTLLESCQNEDHS